MKSQRVSKHSKETYVSPEVVVALGVDLESELLVGSPGTEVQQSILSVGHEIGGEYTISEDYWE